MNCAIICKSSYTLLILKSIIYISLSVVFYIFYCTEVVKKFAERDTNLILSQEVIEENETNPPFITFCMTPRSKNSILEDYKLSRGVLNEPNSNDQKILISLNKTVETLFREVTYKLNRDFHLYISLWFYEDEFGWHSYEVKMKEGSDNYIETENGKHQFIIKELPSFYDGMCYIIESKQRFDMESMTAAIEKKDMDIDSMKIWLTSDYDFLRIATQTSKSAFFPFQFTIPFAGIYTAQIKFRETIIKPLKCKISDPEYVSEQQCLVNMFIDESFSPCPIKCTPIQMKGFQYVNKSASLKNCNKLEDEVCNGGPKVGSKMRDEFQNCLDPCNMITYKDSHLELREMMYGKDYGQARASFELTMNNIRKIEKQVLVYDTTDVIGAIGGSLGLFLGFSFFDVISKCLDSLIMRLVTYFLVSSK